MYKLNAKEKEQVLEADVLCLVETWKLTDIKLEGEFLKYGIIQQNAERKGARGRGIGGIVILYNHNKLEISSYRKTSNLILAKLKVKTSNSEVMIACVCIQPCDPDDRLAESIDMFKRWKDSANGTQKLILIGDFNARIGSLDIISPQFTSNASLQASRSSCYPIVNTQSRRLLKLLEDSGTGTYNTKWASK
jgi:hypothetical protein